MSGHSKWSQIKRKKGTTDAKRGQLFSKISKQITVASRLGKGLDLAIAAAKSANMPKDNIDRAIAKGQGASGDTHIEEALYEAYGPGGAGLLINVVTDNKNRTLGELRAVYNKLGGRPAESGAVRFLFDHRAIFEVAIRDDTDTTTLALIEAGVDDVEIEDDRVIGYAAPDQFATIRSAIDAQGLTLLETRLAWVPKLLVTLPADQRDKVLNLMEAIDELDDVLSVETNADL